MKFLCAKKCFLLLFSIRLSLRCKNFFLKIFEIVLIASFTILPTINGSEKTWYTINSGDLRDFIILWCLFLQSIGSLDTFWPFDFLKRFFCLLLMVTGVIKERFCLFRKIAN